MMGWGPGHAHQVTAGVVAMLLMPAIASAQPVEQPPDEAAPQSPELRGRLGELGRDEQQAERDLGDATVREGDARQVLADVSRELDDAEDELDAMRGELARRVTLQADAAEAADAARDGLTAVEAERELAEAELGELRDRLEQRVRAAFKYGQISFLEAFVGDQDIVDVLNATTYVNSVLDADRELVAEVSALLAEVEAQRAAAASLRAEAEHQAAAADAATAEVQRATLEQQRLTELIAQRQAEQQQALLALGDDRASIEAHLTGLAAEGQRIGEQLATIARQQADETERAAAAARVAEAAAAAAAAETRAESERRSAATEARAEEERLAAAERLAEAAEEQRRRAAAEASVDVAEEKVDEQAEEEIIAPSPTPEPPPVSPTAPAPSTGGWTRPVAGHVSSSYGPRWGRNHNGVDLAGSTGTTVLASRPGTIVSATTSCHPTSSFGCGGGFGNHVTVAHADGFATIYAHLSAVSIGSGQSVSAGQAIGAVGNSGSSYGAHLHLEVRVGGAPRDPCGYIAC